MRGDREALVRQRFAQQMCASLPQFEAASFGEHWADLICYRWAIAADLAFFVTLRVAPREDRFSVVLTWMHTGRQVRQGMALTVHANSGPAKGLPAILSRPSRIAACDRPG